MSRLRAAMGCRGRFRGHGGLPTLIAALAIACRPSAPPTPSSPATEVAASVAPGGSSAPAPTIDSAGEVTATASSDADAAVVAAVLSFPDLQQYMHAEAPGRVPVVLVASNLVSRALQLDAFQQHVRVVSPNELERDRAHLLLSRLSSTPAVVTVSVDYPIEGVSGVMTVERNGSGWRVSGADLRERRATSISDVEHAPLP